MCGAPDRRSPLAALAQPPSDTTHVSVTKPLTPTLPLLVLIQSPSPLLPYAPDSLLPPSPLHPGPGLQDPVNNTFRFGSLSTAYTGPVIHCPPLCPFCPSSVLQTSVDPGLLITSAFYTPPALNYPPYPPLPNTYNPIYSDPLVV